MKQLTKVVVSTMAKAQKGVEYVNGKGAFCPLCGERMVIITTRRWSEGVRVRYHRCQRVTCVLAKLDLQVKSVEVVAG